MTFCSLRPLRSFFASFAVTLFTCVGKIFNRKGREESRKGRKENRRSYLRLASSSAMYMISCLKINRLGWSSRVNLTMFLS